MTSMNVKSLRLGAALLAMGLAGVSPAVAAQQIRTVYSPSQLREDPSAALTRHLRSLADSPRSPSALIGAGEASLALGDPQTALTFFARAEEVAPRDGRVKAGMGSAFVLLEQPAAALRFFGEAASLGIPVARFAGDRGLAYDLTGDPQRAQADYALALRGEEDAEVRQRLALSLAISGNREAALSTIEALVRKQDRSAWRTRAFILALTGDEAGATAATEAVMPGQAAAMRPFYAGLPGLTPAQRAMAVHFGHFPTGTQPLQTAQATPGPVYSGAVPAATQTGRPDARQPALGRRAPTPPASTAPRRRPGADETIVEKVGPGSRAYAPRNRSTRAAQATRPPRQQQQVALARNSAQAPAPTAPNPAPADEAPEPRPAFSTVVTNKPDAAPPSRAAVATSPDRREPAAPVATIAASPSSSTSAQSVARRAPVPFGPPTSGTPPRVADISETVQALQAPAKAPSAEEEKPTPKPEKKVAPAKPKAPSRHWVQIAGGANKASLPREFDRLKTRAPKLLSGKTAWTAPLRFTNRLLVGPFDSESEAQSFVNELAKVELAAFSWTSPAGQEIEKLSAR